ncbi:MAG: hypothetical protein ACJAU0_001735 [Flavobacteriales bacterium]|jgi:hypothetical protein
MDREVEASCFASLFFFVIGEREIGRNELKLIHQRFRMLTCTICNLLTREHSREFF